MKYFNQINTAQIYVIYLLLRRHQSNSLVLVSNHPNVADIHLFHRRTEHLLPSVLFVVCNDHSWILKSRWYNDLLDIDLE